MTHFWPQKTPGVCLFPYLGDTLDSSRSFLNSSLASSNLLFLSLYSSFILVLTNCSNILKHMHEKKTIIQLNVRNESYTFRPAQKCSILRKAVLCPSYKIYKENSRIMILSTRPWLRNKPQFPQSPAPSLRTVNASGPTVNQESWNRFGQLCCVPKAKNPSSASYSRFVLWCLQGT